MWTSHDIVEVNSTVVEMDHGKKVEKRDDKKTKSRKASPPAHMTMTR